MGNRRVRIKCSTNICESEGLINTFIYCFLICLLVMTIVGYTQTKVPNKADDDKRNDTITDVVFLKCDIYITDDDRLKLPSNDGNRRSIDSTDSYRSTKLKNSKMKRKYQKRKRSSYITNRSRVKRAHQNNQLDMATSRDGDSPTVSNQRRYVNCSFYPSHKIVTWFADNTPLATLYITVLHLYSPLYKYTF